MLPEITRTILNAKSAKGLTFAELARAVGCHPVWLASACYRQASATHEQAVKLLDALGLDHTHVPALTSIPVKGGLLPDVPTDPLVYRQGPAGPQLDPSSLPTSSVSRFLSPSASEASAEIVSAIFRQASARGTPLIR